MSLSGKLDQYAKGVAAWLEQSKRQTAAVQRLFRAVGTGNTRDIEKLRESALAAGNLAQERAHACPPFEFDARGYLSPQGEFLAELKEAAQATGVRLYERDGVIFCYPVIVRPEPDLCAVRIDKKLEPSIRPETLASILKKAQAKQPRARPERFIETMFEAYELVRAKRRWREYMDVPLGHVYEVLTLLPGAQNEYTALDFARDIYFLDTSGLTETRKGYRMSLTAATATRESPGRVVRFVTRDGQEKVYSGVRFRPPE